MTSPQRNTPKGDVGTVSPTLTRVVRLDSVPAVRAVYTPEGYLEDTPILTSTGIFEYTNPDGTIRRELRLPDEVFKPESLESYLGKPIVVTHDAGLITKDNVHDNAVGTILSEGFQDGDSVRAKIIIHDTDEMKASGLKELSLGYNLDLDETPGVWNGQPYDAIQRNIVINHLALVLEARAGEQARLNIDGRDRKTKGAKSMSANPKTKKKARRADGVMSPEDLAQAIATYKARRAERLAAKAKADEEGDTVPVADTKPTEGAAPAADGDDTIIATSGKEDGDDIANQVQMVKDRRDRRDEGDEPADKEAAMGVIAQQDGDMDILFDIIDTLLAERDFDSACDTDGKNCDGDEGTATAPAATVPAKAQEDEDDESTPAEPPAAENTDGDEDDIPTTNASEVGKSVLNVDAVDQIVRQRIQLGIVGRALNMDGLEDMGIMAAKKAVIRAVRPGMRLDGKSVAYINAAYDYAVADVTSRNRKDTSYQIKQMFNQDGRQPAPADDGDSSIKARQRMIDRQQNKKKEDK